MISADYYFTFGCGVSNELMKMCLQQPARCFQPLLSLKPLLIMELGQRNVVASCAGYVYLTITQRLPLVVEKFA